jgi:predicted transposase YbfD/YdcC
MEIEAGYQRLFWLSKQIPDWRKPQGSRHDVPEALFVAVVALLAGAQDCEGIARFGRSHLGWLRQVLTLANGIPSHDFFLRLFAAIKPEQFEALVRVWQQALVEPDAMRVDGFQVAFDGQSLRASVDRGRGLGPVHMVSAFLTEAGFTLGCVRTADKSNEITAIPDLMRSLNLVGATITIDAMGCQREIAKVAVECGADYLLQAKENQPTLLENIKVGLVKACEKAKPGEKKTRPDRHVEVDKGHGRVETRTTIVCKDLSAIERPEDWAGLAGIASVLRERFDCLSGHTSKEISFYILSKAKASAAEVAKLARNHWAIESLHWSLDVVWGSDAHTIRNRTGAENMARVRRFCAGMVKRSAGWGINSKGIREICGWKPDVIFQVLAGQVIHMERKRVPNVKTRKAKEAASKRRSK